MKAGLLSHAPPRPLLRQPRLEPLRRVVLGRAALGASAQGDATCWVAALDEFAFLLASLGPVLRSQEGVARLLHSTTLFAFDDVVDAVRPGDRVEVTGIFRAIPRRVNPRVRTVRALFRTYVDAVHFRKEGDERKEYQEALRTSTARGRAMHYWSTMKPPVRSPDALSPGSPSTAAMTAAMTAIRT